MANLERAVRTGATSLLLIAASACANTGGLGSILGSVLGGGVGGGQSSQVSGRVQGVNTRSQQIGLQQSNGQTVALNYDNQTQVVYQNRNYPVTSLEYGDQVTARISNSNNNGYYTDLVQVDQSVSGSGSANGNQNVQSIQGNVRQVDQVNGLFTVNAGNQGTITVSLPYNVSRADLNRFQSLRSGDYVRFYGIVLNNSRVELRQFY